MKHSIKIHGSAVFDYIYATSDPSKLPNEQSYITYEEPKWEESTIALATFASSIDASSFESMEGSLVAYDIYRRDASGNRPTYIGRMSPSDKAIYDYGVRSGDQVKYTIFPIVEIDGEVVRSSSFETESITPSFRSWTLTEMVYVDDGIYQKGEYEWNFYVGVEADEISHVLSSSAHTTNSRYPHIVQQATNYVTSGLAANAGYILCNGEYKEPQMVFRKWEEFLNSKKLKMITDPFGHKYIVTINDSSHLSNDDSKNSTTIRFSYTEVASADDISLCEVAEEDAVDLSRGGS